MDKTRLLADIVFSSLLILTYFSVETQGMKQVASDALTTVSNDQLHLDTQNITRQCIKVNCSVNTSSECCLRNSELIGLSTQFFVYVTIINIIVFLVGVVGNVLVIVVVCKVRIMRNPTNYFLFTLSIADLCVLLVCQPVAMMDLYAKERWYLGEVMCKLIPLFENGILHVSILTMVGVTTERFYSIIYPFRNLANCAARYTIRVIVCIWLVGFTSTIPFTLLTQLEDATFYDGTLVKVCRTLANKSLYKIFIISNNVTFFLITFVVLTYMYARIIRKLITESVEIQTRKDRSATVTLRARKQVVRTLILIIFLFFVSMCPIRVVSLWQIYTPVEQLDELGIESYYHIIWFARICTYINSAGNPIIYCLSSSKFKLAFKRILMRCRSGIRGRRSYNGSSKFILANSRSRRYSPASKPIVQNRAVGHMLINKGDDNGLLIRIKISSNSSS